MDFHTLFPNPIIFVMPVFESYQIINNLLYHLALFICLNDTSAAELKFDDQVQHFANRVILAIPPFFPIFFKSLWVKTGMYVLPSFMWLMFNRPIDFVFVFYKESEEGLGSFLYHRQVARLEKPQRHKVNVPEPGLIITSLYVMGRGSEHTGRFLECTQDVEVTLDFYIKIK